MQMMTKLRVLKSKLTVKILTANLQVKTLLNANKWVIFYFRVFWTENHRNVLDSLTMVA